LPSRRFGRAIWDEDFVIDEAATGAVTCEDGEFLPFINLTATYLALAVQRFLAKGKKIGFSISPSGVEKI
jgi:hypothetical protein